MSGLARNETTSPGTSYTLLTDPPGGTVKESRAVMKLALIVFGWSTCETPMTTGAGLFSQLSTDSRMVR